MFFVRRPDADLVEVAAQLAVNRLIDTIDPRFDPEHSDEQLDAAAYWAYRKLWHTFDDFSTPPCEVSHGNETTEEPASRITDHYPRSRAA